MKRTLNYSYSAEGEQMRKQLEREVNITSAQINLNYLIKVFGDGLNQLVGVGGLLELVGVERAAKMIKRANASAGDVCRCKVYGGVQVSFYIH